MRSTFLSLPVVAFVSLFAASDVAYAGLACSDMDGDGTAETCIETKDTDGDGQDDQANFPGEDPPEVPDPGEGKPVDPPDDDPPEDDGDSGSDDSDD